MIVQILRVAFGKLAAANFFVEFAADFFGIRIGERGFAFEFADFLIALGYTIGYCKLYAYGNTSSELKFVFGFPDWVFWGVLVPWLACVTFSLLFASVIMRDEDLGEDPTSSGADDLGLGG